MRASSVLQSGLTVAVTSEIVFSLVKKVTAHILYRFGATEFSFALLLSGIPLSVTIVVSIEPLVACASEILSTNRV